MSGKGYVFEFRKGSRILWCEYVYGIYRCAPEHAPEGNPGLNIPAGQAYMKEHGIETFVVHAPYIINLANTTTPPHL